MALIGNGAQSEFQALAFHSLLGIDEIAVFDVDPGRDGQAGAQSGGLPVAARSIRAASTAEAVRGADIVTTVTADKAYATILTPEMIEPGMHINAIGGDCPGKTELHRRRAAKCARCSSSTSRRRASRATSSSCRRTSRSPSCGACSPAPARAASAPTQVTVFDSVGFALEDYSTLRYVHEQAERRNLGMSVELVPWAEDPKDLFRHTRSGASHAVMRRVA